MQYRWPDLPHETLDQIMKLHRLLRDTLAKRLIGVYLHGSLAMGCFNPLHSDIDLLVIQDGPLPMLLKHQITKMLLGLSLHPHPIEISFLTPEQLKPWRFPTPYDLHYSEKWRSRLESRLAEGIQEPLADASPVDPDLAAHITIIRSRGIVLDGPPITALFPAVPPQDYLEAIWQHDMSDCADWIDTNPVYGVLNLCRVLAYVMEGLIVSKDEGGQWALHFAPQEYRTVIEWALATYRGEAATNSLATHTVTLTPPQELRSALLSAQNRVRDDGVHDDLTAAINNRPVFFSDLLHAFVDYMSAEITTRIAAICR